MRRLLFVFVAVAVLTGVGVCVGYVVPSGAPVAAVAAPLATITGAVPAPTGVYAAYVRPIVMVYRLDPGYEAYSVPVTGGHYRLTAPAGVYAVVETTWKSVGSKAIAVSNVVVVIARPGTTTSLSRGLAGADSDDVPEPNGPRVSVGDIQLLGRGNIQPEFESSLVTALNEAPCAAYPVEDARYGQYTRILNEVRLRASSAVSPTDRRSLQDALATLRTWRATYRLMGSISVVSERDSGRAAGSFRLVQLDTNRTVWTADVSVDSGGFGTLRRRVADEVARFVCKVPERLRVGADQTLTINAAKITWRATWDLEFQRLKGYAGGLSVATYQATATRVAFWETTYSGDCSGTATWPGGLIADPQGLVDLRYRGGMWSYSLNLRWAGPKQQLTVTCKNQQPKLETPLTSGQIGSGEIKYSRFPVHGTNDAPPATWTVYDTTPWR